MTRKEQRAQRLMPGGVPRYVRVYDDPNVYDRYTVLYTGRYANRPQGRTEYIGMSADPYHPLGASQHGELDGVPDAPQGWPPAMGRRCHLGKRIPFTELPDECQRVVLSDYADLWNLTND